MEVYRRFKIKHIGVGQRIASWVQVAPSFSVVVDCKQRHRYAMFECASCHALSLRRLNVVRAGHAICGCSNRAIKHGKSHTPEHHAWVGLVSRCCNPSDKAYADYGGRGIYVCDRWRGKDGFRNFFDDMGLRPSPSHSIDRYPDNDGPYSPDNCRWATKIEQGRNTRKKRILSYHGRMVRLYELAEISGVPTHCLHGRISSGWTPEEAADTPYIRGSKVYRRSQSV